VEHHSVEIEPPHHRKYRALVDPWCRRSGTGAGTSIRKFANELIDSFVDKGECEFARDFGRPCRSAYYLDIMALPRSMMDDCPLGNGLLHAQDHQVAQQVMAK